MVQGAELSMSLDKTSPPLDTRWPELKWPMPAGIFLLPDGAIRDKSGHRYHHVAFAKIGPDDILKLPARGSDSSPTSISLIVTSASVDDPDFAHLHVNFNANDWPHVIITDEFGASGEAGLNDAEQDTMGRLANIMLNVILLMQDRPAYVESGSRITKARSTSRGRTAETWAPN